MAINFTPKAHFSGIGQTFSGRQNGETDIGKFLQELNLLYPNVANIEPLSDSTTFKKGVLTAWGEPKGIVYASPTTDGTVAVFMNDSEGRTLGYRLSATKPHNIITTSPVTVGRHKLFLDPQNKHHRNIMEMLVRIGEPVCGETKEVVQAAEQAKRRTQLSPVGRIAAMLLPGQ